METFMIFLSTPSARRATTVLSTYPRGYTLFLSTPSARRATIPAITSASSSGISIHALREEGDWQFLEIFLRTCISIHALREEGDSRAAKWCAIIYGFLSTPSARRATDIRVSISPIFSSFLSTPSARRATTRSESASRSSPANFYPRPPRGGRRTGCPLSGYYKVISIHALREEGDAEHTKSLFEIKKHFYPRPPRGGRRTPGAHGKPAPGISIHALREEGDRSHYAQIESGDKFLSTPSARRATQNLAICGKKF